MTKSSALFGNQTIDHEKVSIWIILLNKKLFMLTLLIAITSSVYLPIVSVS